MQQPGMMQPGMMQQAPPVQAPQMQAMAMSGPPGVPPGAPPGGQMVHEKYPGQITWISAGVCCVCTCCGCLALACPCDERDVYVAPNGKKYTLTGAMISD